MHFELAATGEHQLICTLRLHAGNARVNYEKMAMPSKIQTHTNVTPDL